MTRKKARFLGASQKIEVCRPKKLENTMTSQMLKLAVLVAVLAVPSALMAQDSKDKKAAKKAKPAVFKVTVSGMT